MPFGEAEAFTIPVLVTKGKRYVVEPKTKITHTDHLLTLSPVIPKKASKDYTKLIEKCWNQKAEKRLSFTDIVGRVEDMYSETLKKLSGPKPFAYRLDKRVRHLQGFLSLRLSLLPSSSIPSLPSPSYPFFSHF